MSLKDLISIFRDSTGSFEGQESGERVVMLLRKHPFVIYVRLCFFLLLALIPIVLGTVFYTLLKSKGLMPLFLFVSSIWYLILWLLAFYALTMYSLNILLITDRRIVDREQKGFFNRKISELHVSKIQDISVHTKGLIETFLKFGKVVVQTAATEREFCFSQIPHPERVKDTIMKIVASKHDGVNTF